MENIIYYVVIVIQVSILFLFVTQVSFMICFKVKGQTRLTQQVFFASLLYGGAIWLTTLIN